MTDLKVKFEKSSEYSYAGLTLSPECSRSRQRRDAMTPKVVQMAQLIRRRYKHCIMTDLIRLTMMQAVRLGFCIMTNNLRFPFFLSCLLFCKSCKNDSELLVRRYKHCSL